MDSMQYTQGRPAPNKSGTKQIFALAMAMVTGAVIGHDMKIKQRPEPSYERQLIYSPREGQIYIDTITDTDRNSSYDLLKRWKVDVEGKMSEEHTYGIPHTSLFFTQTPTEEQMMKIHIVDENFFKAYDALK